jgi:hypothetical protein
MSSISYLAHTPTCLSEELELTREFTSDMRTRRKEFMGLMDEHPALRKFFQLVNRRLDYTSANVIWFRIWIAMREEKNNGVSHTITALTELPDFDPDDIPYPPDSETKLITYYIGILDKLIERGKNPDAASF